MFRLTRANLVLFITKILLRIIDDGGGSYAVFSRDSRAVERVGA
jgi:hypothetical protein